MTWGKGRRAAFFRETQLDCVLLFLKKEKKLILHYDDKHINEASRNYLNHSMTMFPKELAKRHNVDYGVTEGPIFLGLVSER